jgi:hypothetical protein
MPRSSSLLRFFLFIFISLILVFPIYAMGEVPSKTTTTTVVSSASPGMQKYISADIYTDKQAYKIGEPINIVIKAKNKGNVVAKSYYPSSMKSEVVIYDDKNNVVWNSSHGKMALTVILDFELKPNEQVENEHVWLQQRNDGEKVSPGKYYVQGKVNVTPSILTRMREIQIVD